MEADAPFDVFVSYSEKDRLIAQALVERLRREGVRYWWAPEALMGGTNYQEVIARDIPRCRALLLLLSDKAGYSNHVRKEVAIAMEEGKPILPVRIEKMETPVHLRYALTGEQWLDAFPGFRQHLDTIARTLLTLLESLRQETPVVRLLEPADGATPARGTPLRVVFDVMPGSERRLRRMRLELRRDGTLLHHRALAESEIHDRGGRHEVEWQLPDAVADGGKFQLAVLAADNHGQEGVAQTQGSFALGGPAATPVPEPMPAASPAPAAAAPPVAKPSPTRAGRAAEGAFAALFGVGAWSFRLVWVLALAGAAASVAHQFLEPYAAKRDYKTWSAPPPSLELPASMLKGGLFDRSGPGSKSAEMVNESPPPGKQPEPATPAPPQFPRSDLRTKMLEDAARSAGSPYLGRDNPNPLENMRVFAGPRIPGRPVMAIFNIPRRSDEYSIGWHAPIPQEEADKVPFWTAAGQGAGLGARLGLVAGVVAGLLAFGIAAVRRIPLAMLPLVEEKTFWSDFGIVVAVVGLTILDTGAKLPDTGRWSTPLFCWVAGLTAFCLLVSNTVKNALNHRRQQALLG